MTFRCRDTLPDFASYQDIASYQPQQYQVYSRSEEKIHEKNEFTTFNIVSAYRTAKCVLPGNFCLLPHSSSCTVIVAVRNPKETRYLTVLSSSINVCFINSYSHRLTNALSGGRTPWAMTQEKCDTCPVGNGEPAIDHSGGLTGHFGEFRRHSRAIESHTLIYIGQTFTSMGD